MTMGRWIRRVAVGLLALLALVTYVLWPRSIRTERHVVRYWGHQEAEAQALASRVDALGAKVEASLHAAAAPDPAPVWCVPIEGAVGRHLSGHILVDVARQDEAQTAQTFTHESVHRVAHSLHHGRAHRYVIGFEEGVALITEHELAGADTPWSLAAWSIGHGIRELEIALDRAYAERVHRAFTGQLLGALLVFAVRARYGEEAPGRVLRAFAGVDPEEAGEGREVWRAVLDRAGMDLDEVEAAYEAEVQDNLREERTIAELVPEPRAVRSGARALTVQLRSGTRDVLDLGQGVELRASCRFRAPGQAPVRVPTSQGTCEAPAMWPAEGIEGQAELIGPMSLTFATRWKPLSAFVKTSTGAE